MEIRNPWTSYLTRSYEQMKLAIIQRLSIKLPELKDYSQSNLLIVITDIFAGVAEMLNFYIDAIFRELFPTTALRLTSAIKIARQQGYWGNAAIPASSDVTLVLVDTNEDPISAVTEILIPAGTLLKDTTDNVWTTSHPAIIKVGVAETIVLARQYEQVGPIALGTTSGLPDQVFKLGTDYAHGSAALTVDGVPWTLVDTLGLYPGTAKVYMIKLEEDGFMYILFGDNINGAIPIVSSQVALSLQSTTGSQGNTTSNTITTLVSSITVPVDTTLTVNNKLPSNDGKAVENVYSFSRSIPRAVYTLNRAVTKKDFQYVAEMAPGIREALVGLVCGGSITIYIAPFTTGIASASQIASTKEYVEERANLTVGDVVVKSAGESKIKLALEVKAFPNAMHDTIMSDIQKTLLYLYNVDVQDIGGSVKLSDIYSAVDPINNVDYVDIPTLYVEPYIRPYNSEIQLDSQFVMTADYTKKGNYKIVYVSASNYFSIYVGNTLLLNLPVNVLTLIEPGLSLYIAEDLTIPDGTMWTFETNPFGTNIFLTDNSLPVLDYENLIISFI